MRVARSTEAERSSMLNICTLWCSSMACCAAALTGYKTCAAAVAAACWWWAHACLLYCMSAHLYEAPRLCSHAMRPCKAQEIQPRSTGLHWLLARWAMPPATAVREALGSIWGLGFICIIHSTLACQEVERTCG